MINFYLLDNSALDVNSQTEYMRFRYDLILAWASKHPMQCTTTFYCFQGKFIDTMHTSSD
jgi:hypothetical protein